MRLIDADTIPWVGFPNDFGEYHEDYVEKRVVDKMPTIEARPVVRGEWIEKPHTDGFGGHYFLYHCSRCDTPIAKKRNFCNECGADNRGEDDA